MWSKLEILLEELLLLRGKLKKRKEATDSERNIVWEAHVNWQYSKEQDNSWPNH